MMRGLTFAACAVAALGLLASTNANAGFPVEVEKTCPVGGEEFTFITTGSYSTFGARPDGKPYGSWTFPLEMPVCPENALVMYRDFEEDELTELTQLVLSDSYQGLRDETSYYRASWLSERLDGEESRSYVWLLMRATWQVDHDPELKARYQLEFAEKATRFDVDPEDTDSLFLRFRVANAYRELGNFEAALTALDNLPIAALDVDVPESDDVEYERRQDAQARRFLFELAPLMRSVIVAEDKSSEPLALMPADFVASVCVDLIEEGETDLPERCDEPAVRDYVDRFLARRRQS